MYTVTLPPPSPTTVDWTELQHIHNEECPINLHTRTYYHTSGLVCIMATGNMYTGNRGRSKHHNCMQPTVFPYRDKGVPLLWPPPFFCTNHIIIGTVYMQTLGKWHILYM